MNTKAFQKLSYGLYLISTKNEEKTAGCVVNTLTQATSSPARVTVTINKDNFTAKMLLESGVFAAVALAQSATMELIGAFGFHSSADTDKFGGFATGTDGSGVPYVKEQAVARLSCKVVDRMDAGTHYVFLADVLDAEVLEDSEPMTYSYYHLVKKGVTPPRASSYVAEPAARGYRCKICGYVLESDAIPDDFVCPVCGQGEEQLEKIV